MHYFFGKGCSESLESMHYCIGILMIDVLYFVLIYTQKGLFQWPSYRGEGILATVVKQKNTAV